MSTHPITTEDLKLLRTAIREDLQAEHVRLQQHLDGRFAAVDVQLGLIDDHYVDGSVVQTVMMWRVAAGVGDQTTLRVFTPAGRLLGGADYHGEQMLQLVEGDPALPGEPQVELNYYCMQTCVLQLWPRLPYFLRLACGTVGRLCFTGQLWACPSAIACAGGILFTCYYACH